MSHGYFIFHFTNYAELDPVLLDGPWALDDAVLALGLGPLIFDLHRGYCQRSRCVDAVA